MRGRKTGLNLTALLQYDRQNAGEYTPMRGKELISIMAQGHSVTVAAGKMGVRRRTIYKWAKKYPEFAEALENAEGLRVFYLETQLLTARDMRTVNAAIRALRQAAPEEWGDKDKDDVQKDARPIA